MAQGNVLSAQHGHNVGCLLCLLYQLQTGFAKLLHSGTVFPTLQDDAALGTEKGPEQTQIRGSSRAPQDMGQASDASFEERPVPPNGMSLCCCIRAPRQAKRPSQLRCWAGRRGGERLRKGGCRPQWKRWGGAFRAHSECCSGAEAERQARRRLLHCCTCSIHMPLVTCHRCRAKEERPKVPSIGVELRSPFDASAQTSRRVSKQFGGCFCQEARCRRLTRPGGGQTRKLRVHNSGDSQASSVHAESVCTP